MDKTTSKEDRIRKMAEEYASRNFVEDAEKLFNEPFDKEMVRYAGILEKFAKDCIEHQWMSLEERYPEHGESIMLCYQSFYNGRWLTIHTTDRYYKDMGFIGGNVKPENVIAWMPIPPINL